MLPHCQPYLRRQRAVGFAGATLKLEAGRGGNLGGHNHELGRVTVLYSVATSNPVNWYVNQDEFAQSACLRCPNCCHARMYVSL